MNPTNLLDGLSVGKAITAAWVFFVTVFFLYSVSFSSIENAKLTEASQIGYQNGFAAAANQAMSSFSGNTLQNGYNNGYGTAILQLAQALAAQYEGGCKEAVPVTIGSGSVGIISIDCLQQVASGQTAPQTAPTAPVQAQ